MFHVKKKDQVIVLAGKSIGKKGKVVKVFPKEERAIVEGINMVKRHSKPRPPKVPQGGILEKAMPIHLSNIMLICPECNRPARTNKVVLENGKVSRKCKKCKKNIDFK